MDVAERQLGHHFATDRVEDAAQHLGGVLAPHRFRDVGSLGALGFVHTRATMGAVSLHRIGYGAAVTLDVLAPLDFYLFQFTVAGSTRLAFRDREVETPPDHLSAVNPGEPFSKVWRGRTEQLMLRMDRHLVENAFREEMDATLPPGALRFLGAALPAGQFPLLAQLLRIAPGDELPTALARPAVARRLADALVHLVLHELPHTHRGALDRTASPAAPRSVRRAEDYIQAHARDDITLGEVVRASGVSRRALHAAFRHFRETTPLAYLHEVRLCRAREMLLTGQADSVTRAAEESGLRHLGRFAREYAVRFGERPSETMRRLRR